MKALALALLLATGCKPTEHACIPHTVILVRHAERAGEKEERDPELSPQGRERAKRLATMLAHSGASRLVATEFKRTQQTLEPLGATLGLHVEVMPGARDKDLVSELRKAAPSSVTVVATHSNVLPVLVTELGGGPLRGVGADHNLPHDDFGRVVIVSAGCTPTPALELSSD